MFQLKFAATDEGIRFLLALIKKYTFSFCDYVTDICTLHRNTGCPTVKAWGRWLPAIVSSPTIRFNLKPVDARCLQLGSFRAVNPYSADGIV
jgi:hypothetical protein